MKSRQPCSGCPWRVGVDAWAIGRDHTPEVPPLHRAQMEDIAASHECGGFEARMMACHLTHAGDDQIPPHDRICVGYALRAADDNLNFRMLAMGGRIDPRAFSCAEPLHADFAAMLAANPERGETAGEASDG